MIHLFCNFFINLKYVSEPGGSTNEIDPKGIANSGKMFPADRVPGI